MEKKNEYVTRIELVKEKVYKSSLYIIFFQEKENIFYFY